MKEEWKPFPHFESDYLISNTGRVFSVRANRCLTPKFTAAGYLRISPSVNGYRREVSIHRAVAQAFIPNVENKPTVNPKNEVKTDNRVENLEWATTAEQNVYGTRIERVKSHTDYYNRGIDYAVVAAKHDYYQMNKKQMKPVIQLDTDGNSISCFGGVSEAARSIGVSAGHLCNCLKGVRKTCGGYKWKYAETTDTMQSL